MCVTYCPSPRSLANNLHLLETCRSMVSHCMMSAVMRLISLNKNLYPLHSTQYSPC